MLGPINPSSLGKTMTHEHLYHKADARMFTPRPPDPKYSYLSQAPFEADNLWWINFHPYSHRENLIFDDVDTQESVLEEMKFYKNNGGGSIVECTTFGRDLKVLKSLSRESGVNIVAGTGFYVHLNQPSSALSMSSEQMYNLMKRELVHGDSNGIKCGIIGEIGTCYPLDIFEKKVLKAAAAVSIEYPTIPVSIHPGRDKRAPLTALRYYLENGGKIDKVVLCHLERSLLTREELIEFASQGSFCEFDLFGIETTYYELSDELDMPSDADRINRLKQLIDAGFGQKLLVAQDIHTKQRLMAYGGHGYSHVLMNAVPKMKLRGFTDQNIEDILVNNPKTWLTL